MSHAPHPAVRLALFGVVLAGPLTAPVAVRAADPIAWRTDYNAARKEAQEKGLPLLVSISSDNCLYCRKMDAVTFRDPAVAALLNGRFVPLKVEAANEPALVQALRVQMYPTTVLAGPDGKILAFVQGFVAADAFKDHANRAVLAVSTPDWVARDLQEANKAIGGADYTRAVSLLKGIAADAKDSPAKTKARQVLGELEQAAADRLARAKSLEAKGETTAATDALTDLMRTYAGTPAAAEASARLTGLAGRGPAGDRLRAARARDLLAMARDEFRSERFADCLDHCDLLAARYADLPEAGEAATLAAQVKADPDRLAAACDQASERTAAMYLALADAQARRGNTREAAATLEKVARSFPASRQAEVAEVRLAGIKRGDTSAVQTGFEKK